MKVLLVRNHDVGNVNTRLPESLNRAQGIYPPLGIAHVASFLEQNGVDAEVLDAKALNLTSTETKERIGKAHADIVGVTAMTPNCRGALEICKFTKEVDSHILTVVGGPQMNVFPAETVSDPNVDVGVIGDGELAMLKLARNFGNHKNVPRIMHGRRVLNLDSLPFPARHLLPNERYYCVIAKHPFTTMITSRGCPFKCGFCYSLDKRVRYRSAENVVDEMEQAVEKYRFKEVMFYDDCFTLNRKRVVAVCKEIIRRKLDVCWETPTRVDLVDFGLLKLMRKAGCIRIRYGVESGDENILKVMGKGVTLKQAEKAFEATRKARIETFAYFILGYIRETIDTMQKTIDFAKKLDPDWAMFTVATPLPETRLHAEAVKHGLIDADYWRDFTLGKRSDRVPFMVPDADKWVNRAYRQFYFRPSFIAKKIGKVGSLNTLKRNLEGAWGILRFEMT
ncbi:MAG: cobalamin B12-binding domain-containing protein [Desulfobacterales bacterium]|nr:cobalamin B12-binding domain-containing protein [Desulfobacterales bacterium]